MEYVSTFETVLGPGAVVASRQGIQRVYLPHDNAPRSEERRVGKECRL